MENLTPEDTLPGGEDITPSDGTGTDPNAVVELKDILNQALKKAPGQEFKTNEDALKAVQDTFSYVGKAGWHKKAIETYAQARGLDEKSAVKLLMDNNIENKPAEQLKVETVVDTSKVVSREEYDRDMFFGKNPDYEPYKAMLTDLQKATGKPLSEVVQLDSVKGVFEKVKAHDANEKSRSVLMSNSRLGQVTDKMTEAQDAMKVAREAGMRGDSMAVQQAHSKASTSAVKAVMEAYNL